MTSSHPLRPTRDLRAIVVASWFPAADDTTKGRFVADQVEALRATGAVDPIVVSFDPAQLSGGPIGRRRQAAAVHRSAVSAIGRDPRVFSPSGWTGPVGIPVARLPIPSGGRGIGAPTHPAQDRRIALAALADQFAPDGRTVIHAHTGYPDGAAATSLIDPLRAPLVITEHATFVGQLLSRPAERQAYIAAVRRASRLIVVSQSLADELRTAIPECVPKILVIPNTVPMAEFVPAALDSRRRDELLYVGYRTHTKGIDILLAAFARVRATRSGASLRLIGRSPSEEIEAGWHRLATELGVAEAVRFEGPALRSEVAAAMACADVLVHASRRETFGVTVVEALASGLPVVGTDIGPLREILGPAPSSLGALVPTDDAAALAAAILDTLDRRAAFDPHELRAAVEGRFGATAVATRLVEVYEEVLGDRAVRGADRSSARTRTLPVDRSASVHTSTTLVVGFDTPRANRVLAHMPAELLERVWLVCSGGPASHDVPPGVGRIVTVGKEQTMSPGQGPGPVRQQQAAVRRVVRLVRQSAMDVLLPARRRRDRARRDAVARALVALRAERASTDRIDVVCLDGLDYLIAERACRKDLGQIPPGGIRWLADRWAADERPSQSGRRMGEAGW